MESTPRSMSRLKPELSPFRPHFGQSPPVFVGRDPLIDDVGTGLVTGPTDRRYTSILAGTRGSGKTATLNEIEDMAAADGWVVLSLDAATPGLLQRTMDAISRAEEIYEEALGPGRGPLRRSVEKTLGISLGPLTGSMAWTEFREKRHMADLRGHLAFLARAASEVGTSVLLTVDELHAIDRTEGRRLSNDLQHITRRAEAPLAFVGAGLLELKHTLMRDRKMTFFHRCEDYEMPPLTEEDAVAGIHMPIAAAGGSITAEALKAAAAATQGSPYRLQLIGDNAWRIGGAPDKRIDLGDTQAAIVSAAATMDKRIGVPAWHDLAPRQQDALGTLAETQAPMSPRSVAERLGIARTHASKVLAELRDLGYANSETRGEYRISGLVSAQVARDAWDDGLSGSAAGGQPRRPAAAGRTLCRKWMPRAKAYCALSKGHAGGCRSG